MAKIASSIDARAPEFAANRAAMAALVERFARAPARNALGGSEAARNKHREAGKLLVRERVDALLDPGSPFLELSALAAHQVYDDDLPGAGLVTGIGRISGRPCMVVANDPTVKGGTYYPLTVKKHLRAQEIAGENALPCVYLVESGGAFLPKQDEVFPDRDHFGRIFFNQARLSAQGVAQIAVVHGSCTAGGAYVPAMSDHAVIVRNQGRIFLGGPPLVRAATGEEIDAESLGGADVHCRRSGVTDYYARERYSCARLARRAVARLRPPAARTAAPRPRGSPTTIRCGDLRHHSAELAQTLRCARDHRAPRRRLLVRRVQGALRHHPGLRLRRYPWVCRSASSATTGSCFPRARSRARISSSSAVARAFPLLFLQNISGFMVGQAAEAGGIAKDGAKLVTAVACAAVPKYTVIIGGSFGAGNYAMCGRAYAPRLLFQWPNARTSVMGGEQAASVLATIKRDALKRAGGDLERDRGRTVQGADPRAVRAARPSLSMRPRGSGTTACIDPLDTRRALGLALALNSASAATRLFGIFRM